MNRTFCISLLVAGCSTSPVPAELEPHYEDQNAGDPSGELYAPDNLPRFDIKLSEAALDALKDEPREYAEGTFTYRGEVVGRIGVRLKGEYSFREIDEKPGFKLKFNKFVKGQRFRGLKRMTLNNNVQDPSFLSQSLGYWVYRSTGLPAPRANNALVYVNGEYYGVYSNVETEDKVFLARWFDNSEGNLYEEMGVDFLPGTEHDFELETNEGANDRSDLAALVAALDRATVDNFVEVVGRELDVDSYLTYAAVEAILGGEDGYSYSPGGPNNFRIYRDPDSARFFFLPWGLDRALRPRFDSELLHEWIDPLPIYDSPWQAYGLILERCIESPSCKQAFADKLADVANLVEGLELERAADRQFLLIEEAVYADTRKEEDNDYVDYALTTLHDYASGRPASIRAEL